MNHYHIGYSKDSRAIFTDTGTTVEVVGIGLPGVASIIESMSIEEARSLWNYLVSKGFHRTTTAPTTVEYNELLDLANEPRLLARQETLHNES